MVVAATMVRVGTARRGWHRHGHLARIAGHGRYLRFGEGFDDNPFIRMTALAFVLALPPWPGDMSLVVKPAV